MRFAARSLRHALNQVFYDTLALKLHDAPSRRTKP
jgi:hypothetical protein